MEPTLSSPERVGREVARELDQLADRALDLEAARERLLAARPPRSASSRRRASVVAVAATLALAAATALFVASRAPEPLYFDVGGSRVRGEPGAWLSAPENRVEPVAFSDGSRVELRPKTRARVVELRPSGATIIVESGSAELSIRSRPDTDWQITLGPFEVRVKGTRFGVEFDPDAETLTLAMHEGRVVVSGCVFGEGRPAVAGELIRASCRERSIRISALGQTQVPERRHAGEPRPIEQAPPAAPSLAGRDPSSSAGSPGSARAPVLVKEPPSWHELARKGDYKQAFLAADALGFESECAAASAGDLLMLGDAARFSGQAAKAERAYRMLRQRFSGDARAARAAFMLGRIAFDGGAYARAASWLDTYLSESPGGPLAREALGRLIEARQRAGNPAAARRAAESYLLRYPSGPHSQLAQSILAE